jgi:hypothetical protein
MIRLFALGFALVASFPGMSFGQERVKPNYDRDLITREEIRERVPGAKTAWDVVQQLRPHFLRERAPISMAEGTQRSPVQVYVNGVQSVSVPAVSLRDIRADDVIEIKYLNPSDATTRYGTGHLNGAVLVATGK